MVDSIERVCSESENEMARFIDGPRRIVVVSMGDRFLFQDVSFRFSSFLDPVEILTATTRSVSISSLIYDSHNLTYVVKVWATLLTTFFMVCILFAAFARSRRLIPTNLLLDSCDRGELLIQGLLHAHLHLKARCFEIAGPISKLIRRSSKLQNFDEACFLFLVPRHRYQFTNMDI